MHITYPSLKAALLLTVLLSAPGVRADSISSDSYALVQGSDDYQIHKDIFAKTASKLIVSGRCTEDDFMELGGWLKSTNYKSKPIYFTYCGGFTLKNKIYLNTSSRSLF